MFPAAVRASTRLAIPWAVGVTRDPNVQSSPGANVLAMYEAPYQVFFRLRSGSCCDRLKYPFRPPSPGMLSGS